MLAYSDLDGTDREIQSECREEIPRGIEDEATQQLRTLLGTSGESVAVGALPRRHQRPTMPYTRLADFLTKFLESNVENPVLLSERLCCPTEATTFQAKKSASHK